MTTAKPRNALAARILVAVLGSAIVLGVTFVLGVTYQRGLVDAHIKDGHPQRVVSRVAVIEERLGRQDERLKNIERSLRRIERLLRNQGDPPITGDGHGR